MLEIKNLSKEYKDFKLDNINFSIPKGYIMGFIGANGSGKSTTIKSILSLVNFEGEILIDGQINKVYDKNNIGVVMDNPCYYETLKVKQVENITANLYQNWNSEKFDELLNQFKISKDKKIKELSKGMKTKLSIALALSHNAKFLVLDEPTSGLDPIVREEVLDVLYDFVQDENHSILISSHIISDLEKICDYITFIDKGQIIESLSKDELLEKYVIIHGSVEELDQNAIISTRKGEFGVSSLVIKDMIPVSFHTQPASLEDIMLYFAKGERR